MHMGAARKELITLDQDYALVQGLIRQQSPRIRGGAHSAAPQIASTLARILAFLLLGKVVMHDAKNTVNLILDFCKVLEYFWHLGPD